MSRHVSRLVTGVLLTMITVPAESADPLPAGTHDRVQVAAPTRLDWVFTISNQSPAEPPSDWTRGYTSTKQTYRLMVPDGIPRTLPAGKLLPLVLFVSPGDAN